MITLKRAQIGKTPGVDITVKSSHGVHAKAFAPRWDMVCGHKNWTAQQEGKPLPYPKYTPMSDETYTAQYLAILDTVSVSDWHWLMAQAQEGVLTVLCYCRDDWFCHTHLLIDYMMRRAPQKFIDGRKPREENKMKIYTGIGSRRTPPEILEAMQALGKVLGRKGWVLRSGAAPGADTAFEQGCDAVGGQKEIYLPWPGFQNNPSRLYTPSREAFATVAQFHPAPNNLSAAAVKLMARNAHQVLGADMNTPADLVICWTPDGARSVTGPDTGGTGQALRIAAYNGVRIINLRNEADQKYCVDFIARACGAPTL